MKYVADPAYKTSIIREFIGLHNSEFNQHLRSVGLLNPSGTFPGSKDRLKELEDWFVNIIRCSNYYFIIGEDWLPFHQGYVETPIINLEISKFDSASGNPEVFGFPVRAFPVFLPECIWVEVNSDFVDDVWWNKNKEPTLELHICAESREETYSTLFIKKQFGALLDIPGFPPNIRNYRARAKLEIGEAINAAIDGCEKELSEAVAVHAVKTLKESNNQARLRAIGVTLLNNKKPDREDREFLATTLINLTADIELICHNRITPGGRL